MARAKEPQTPLPRIIPSHPPGGVALPRNNAAALTSTWRLTQPLDCLPKPVSATNLFCPVSSLKLTTVTPPPPPLLF